MTNLPGRVARVVALAVTLSWVPYAGGAQTPPALPPVAPAPSPTAAPSAAPKLGPVLVAGKSTYVLAFDAGGSKTVAATQVHAPSGSYFIATPGTICIGAVSVTGSSSLALGGGIISNGPFTFTRVGSTAGCAVSISSSAGGTPATVVFQ